MLTVLYLDGACVEVGRERRVRPCEEVLTGQMGSVGGGGGAVAATDAPVTQGDFVQHAKGALGEFCS